MLQKPASYTGILLAGLLTTAVFWAGCSTTGPAPAGMPGASASSRTPGGAVEGVYTATLSETSLYATVLLDLEQRGERIDGTYSMRSGGEEVRRPLSGTYDGTTLNFNVTGAPQATEFTGTVMDGGRQIRGRLSVGFSDRYDITFRRE